MARETGPSCDTVSCHICELYTCLVNDGATSHSGTSIGEGDCYIEIRFEHEHQCQKQLRLDEECAKYRKRAGRKGQTTKMCDFAIFAQKEEELIISVVEIKNTAKLYAICQLQAGLDMICKYLSPELRGRVNPKAFVVANKKIERLKRIFISQNKKVRLKFDKKIFQPQVKRCGDTLRV